MEERREKCVFAESFILCRSPHNAYNKDSKYVVVVVVVVVDDDDDDDDDDDTDDCLTD
jgi:hypothetical protein